MHMKYTLISLQNKVFIRTRLLALNWLLSLIIFSCVGPTSEQEQEADVRNVLQQSFAYQRLATFLNRSGKGLFSFRYEELPVHNGHPLPKPQFSISLPNQRTVQYNTRMEDEVDGIPILVEQIIINHDSATVNLRIPKQGVIGRFHLGRNVTGTWLVTKAFIVEI